MECEYESKTLSGKCPNTLRVKKTGINLTKFLSSGWSDRVLRKLPQYGANPVNLVFKSLSEIFF